MIALMQRVSSSSVTVDGEKIAEIGQGLMILVGVQKADQPATAEKMAEKLLRYRVFADSEGKMNLSVLDIRGQVLVVPQFTLAADTEKGLRPGFSSAADPQKGRALFGQLVDIMREKGGSSCPGLARDWLQTGQFGADMAVALVNDGPVTFRLAV